jgi:hypothetical protein
LEFACLGKNFATFVVSLSHQRRVLLGRLGGTIPPLWDRLNPSQFQRPGTRSSALLGQVYASSLGVLVA